MANKNPETVEQAFEFLRKQEQWAVLASSDKMVKEPGLARRFGQTVAYLMDRKLDETQQAELKEAKLSFLLGELSQDSVRGDIKALLLNQFDRTIKIMPVLSDAIATCGREDFTDFRKYSPNDAMMEALKGVALMSNELTLILNGEYQRGVADSEQQMLA